MNKKEQQAQRAKQEDVVLNKVLWWIVGAVVLEALLLLLNKVYANYTVEQIELAKSLRDVFSVLMIALPICFVVLLIWAVAARKSGKFTRLSSVLAGVMLALAVCAVVIRVFDESGIRLLYVAVPAVAVLALIYYLYQREFFFAAVLSALGLLGVKVVPYHFGFPAIAYGYAVVLGVALVGAVVVFRVMQAAGGKLRLKGNWVEVLPKSAKGEPETPAATAEPSSTRLVAPVPYGGAGESSAAAPALNWGTVGPQRQTADGGYTYTALPQKPAALPEFGRVDTSWFADAAFLGDSLTAGFCVNEYNIDVGGALVCGYEGISPNTIVNRTTVSSPDRGEEVPLDVLTAAQPAKLYILIGTNALVQPGNDDSFLAYYGKMLDELRTALPNTAFYVQSVLPATQEKIGDTLPGLAPDRLAVINAAIQQLCAERGCYYLDLNAEFADAAGCLMTDFAQPDGVHLTVSGYSRWVSYLCTHLPYSKNNPYQAGSTYYLSEDMKNLLADIP